MLPASGLKSTRVMSCFNSFDLAGRCVALLEQRSVIPAGALQLYIEILQRGT
jgi:hypothetical protein